MDLFRQRAHAILETARFGTSNDITVRFHQDGGLHLVMSDSSAPPQLPQHELREHSTATYQMMRKGRQILVTGQQGKQRCFLEALVPKVSASFLLNDQALYDLSPRLLYR